MTEAELYRDLLYGWIALAGVVFVSLFFVTAGYGRHAGASRGPKIPATLAWVLMEAPSPLGMALCFVLAPHPPSRAAWALFGLWELHYLNRSFVFPFRRRGGAPEMSLGIALAATLFNSVNAYLNGRMLTLFGAPGDGWLADPRFAIGAVVFLVGFAVNQHSDWILLHLRKPGERGYKIPYGGLYRYVSCPNYLGELCEWIGFAIASWSLAGASFAVWTAANLVPRARAHHRWYREQFADYPKGRRALLPFLF